MHCELTAIARIGCWGGSGGSGGRSDSELQMEVDGASGETLYSQGVCCCCCCEGGHAPAFMAVGQ